MSTNISPVEKTAAAEKTRYATISGGKRFNIILKLSVAILGSLFSLYPVAYIVGASLNPTNSLQDLIPQRATVENYSKLASDEQYPILLWMVNSIKVAAISTVIIVTLCAMAAYAFSRMRFRGRRTGLLVILLIQLFPNMLAIVALYLLLLNIKDVIPWLGLNTHGGLILIYSAGALGFNTWLMKGFFDTIPKELDESADMDGASRTQTFLYILLPLVRPVLAVIGILAFIGTYSDFLIARVMLSTKENYTLAVGMNLLISDQFSKNWGQFAAAALVGAAPIVLIFLLLQKQLIGGLTSGSVKG